MLLTEDLDIVVLTNLDYKVTLGLRELFNNMNSWSFQVLENSTDLYLSTTTTTVRTERAPIYVHFEIQNWIVLWHKTMLTNSSGSLSI